MSLERHPLRAAVSPAMDYGRWLAWVENRVEILERLGQNASGGGGGTVGPPGPQGPPGVPGEDGEDGRHGSFWWVDQSSPVQGQGQPGDLHLDASNGDVWQNQSGTWVLIGNIEGPMGPIGPAGPPGAGSTSTVEYLYGGNVTGVDPGVGYVRISGTGSNPRVFAINETDADGQLRFFGPLQAGDTIVITDDPDTPPVSGFARYLIVDTPVDHGSWWSMTTLRTDTAGSTATPPIGTRLRLTAHLTDGSGAGVTEAPEVPPDLPPGSFWWDTDADGPGDPLPGLLHYKTDAGVVVPVSAPVVMQPPSPAVKFCSWNVPTQTVNIGANFAPLAAAAEFVAPEGGFTITGNGITVQEAGWYRITIGLGGSWASPPANSYFVVTLRVNGAVVANTIRSVSTAFWQGTAANWLLQLPAGAVITAGLGGEFWTTFGVNPSFGRAGSSITRVDIEGLKGERGEPGLDGNPASWARAGRTSDWTIPNPVTTVPWSVTEVSDADDYEWVGGTTCRIKKAGVYLVTFDGSVIANLYGSTDLVQFGIRTGSSPGWLGEVVQHTSGLWSECYTSQVIDVAAGETVFVESATNSQTPALAGNAGGHRSQFTIVRLSGQKGDKGDPGDVSLAQLNALPKGKVAFAQAVVNQVGIGGADTDLVGLSATWTAVTGRAYKISGLVRVNQRGGANGTMLCRISRGDNTAIASSQMTMGADGSFGTLTPWVVVTPAAGAVTYKLRLSSTVGTVDTAASATSPALLLVEDIGLA